MCNINKVKLTIMALYHTILRKTPYASNSRKHVPISGIRGAWMSQETSAWTVAKKIRDVCIFEQHFEANTLRNQVGFLTRENNFFLNDMTEKYVLKELLNEKKVTKYSIFFIKGSPVQQRWCFHFRARHTTERHLSPRLLSKKLRRIEEKAT